MEDELSNNKRKVPMDLKLRYLEIKGKMEPDLVANLLQRYNFPLDDSLKVCEQTGNYFGAAYIKSRLGQREKALKDYLTVKSYF